MKCTNIMNKETVRTHKTIKNDKGTGMKNKAIILMNSNIMITVNILKCPHLWTQNKNLNKPHNILYDVLRILTDQTDEVKKMFQSKSHINKTKWIVS